jgi:phage head maturation protease
MSTMTIPVSTRDMTVRAYSVAPDTADREARTVMSTMATENPVWVMDLRTWEPIREILLMDGATVPDQVPLLDSHDRSSVTKVRGSTRNIRVDGVELVGDNHFASDADSQEAFDKVADGHVRDNSIGYRVTEHVTLDTNQSEEINGKRYDAGPESPLRIVTQWRLLENSLTPIGADPDATMRKEPDVADQKSKDKPVTKPDTTPADEQRSQEPAAKPAEQPTPTPTETELRRRDIMAIAPEALRDVAERCIVEGKTVDEARAVLLEELNKRVKPVGTPEPKEPEKPGDTKDREVTDDVLLRSITG